MSQGHKNPDDHMAVGLASLRLDGFVSLSAGGEPGTVTTRPFVLEGSQLELNVDAFAGQVCVEVLNGAGQPLPGFTRRDCCDMGRVDALRRQPGWQDEADLAADRVRRLRHTEG